MLEVPRNQAEQTTAGKDLKTRAAFSQNSEEFIQRYFVTKSIEKGAEKGESAISCSRHKDEPA